MTPSEDRIQELSRRLGVWCEQVGHAIDAAGRVDEAAAAAILGRSPGTLRNWRAQAIGPAYYRSTPVRYSLADLAAFIEGTRLDHDESRSVTTRHCERG